MVAVKGLEKAKTIKSEYVPGVCNIGPAEIRRRVSGGWIGTVVAVALWAVLVVVGVAPGWRLFVFIPAVMAATGFLQAAFHFCANFGMRGVFNFRSDVGKTDNVMQAEFRKQDRRKALLIILLSVLIGAAVAVIGALLPI